MIPHMRGSNNHFPVEVEDSLHFRHLDATFSYSIAYSIELLLLDTYHLIIGPSDSCHCLGPSLPRRGAQSLRLV